MCLLSDVIHWFVINNIDYEPESIYVDVRVSISHFFSKFYFTRFYLFREIVHFRLVLTRPIHCFIWQLAVIQKSSWNKILFYVQCLIVWKNMGKPHSWWPTVPSKSSMLACPTCSVKTGEHYLILSLSMPRNLHFSQRKTDLLEFIHRNLEDWNGNGCIVWKGGKSILE